MIHTVTVSVSLAIFFTAIVQLLCMQGYTSMNHARLNNTLTNTKNDENGSFSKVYLKGETGFIYTVVSVIWLE